MHIRFGVLALLTTVAAHAQPLVYEPFDYPAGNEAAHGGLGFSEPYTTAIDVAAPGLTYSQGAFPSVDLPVQGNRLVTSGTGVPTFRGLEVPAPGGYGATGSTLYLSFLVSNLGGDGTGWGGVSLYDGPFERLFVGKPSDQISWGFDTQTGVPRTFGSGVPIDATVRLLVVRIDFGDLGDTVRFYLDPPLQAEPAAADIGPVAMANFTFDRIRVTAGNFAESVIPVYQFDEIQLSDSYADILAPKPADGPVRWTGAGDGLTWEDPANWSGLAVPGPADDVEIDVAGAPSITINSAVAVESLQCAEDLTVTSGSLELTDGDSIVSGPFTLQPGTTLTVDGFQAQLAVTGPAGIDGANLVAVDGGTMDLPTVFSYSSSTDTEIRAEFFGTIRLPVLDTLAAGQGFLNTRVEVLARDGGWIELPALTSPSGSVRFTADGNIEGEGSLIDLASLGTFDGESENGGWLAATGGGELRTPSLASVQGGRVIFQGFGSTMDLSDLAVINDTTITVDGLDLTFPAVTNLDNSSVIATGFARVDFPVLPSYASNAAGELRAMTEGDELDFPLLAVLAGPTNGDILNVSAADGGRVSMPALVNQSGAVYFVAAGSGGEYGGARIDLSSLAAFDGWQPGFFGGMAAAEGGSILTPVLAAFNNGDFWLDDASGSIDTTLLADIDNASIFLSNGATLTLPLVTTYTSTVGTALVAEAAGTVLSLPNLYLLTGPDVGSLSVQALDGGTVSFPALEQRRGNVSFSSVPGGTITFPAITDRAWTGLGDGSSWEDPLNWSFDLVPDATDRVIIDTAGTVVLSSAADIHSLILRSGELDVVGGFLSATDSSTMTGGPEGPEAALILRRDSLAQFLGGLLLGAEEGGDVRFDYHGGGAFFPTGSSLFGGFPAAGIWPLADQTAAFPSVLEWRFIVDRNQPFEPLLAPNQLLLENVLSSVPNAIRLDIIPEGALLPGDSFPLVSYESELVAPIGRFLTPDGLSYIEDDTTFTSSSGYTFLVDYDVGGAIIATVTGVPASVIVFSENFEADNGGFTVTTSAGSSWQHGTPNSVGPGGSVTTGNGGSASCWGTNIGLPGYYADSTVTKLRSPVIDLTGFTSAELHYAEAFDLEAGDTAVVNIIDDTTDTVLAAAVYTAMDPDISSASWSPANSGEPIAIPAAALGQAVRIEWSFTGFGGATDDYLGWYIDDVAVAGTVPSVPGVLLASSGILAPAFDAAVTEYTLEVAAEVSSLTLTPSGFDPAATLRIAGEVVANGAASSPIPLAVGTNAVTLVVTPPGPSADTIYTIDITRPAAGTVPDGGFFPIDAQASFYQGGTVGPTIMDLASLGIAPGDRLRLTKQGSYDNGTGEQWGRIGAVFSSSDVLLPAVNLERVEGAIVSEFGTGFVTNLDIPEDFGVRNEGPQGLGDPPLDLPVTVPAGATHLFFSVEDLFWDDNSDPDGDFGLSVQRLGTADFPVIATQPAGGVTLAPGEQAILSVTASGDLAPNYQWFEGPSGETSNPVAGATAATFTTPPINAPTSFWVRASNSFGSVDSRTATVTPIFPDTVFLSDYMGGVSGGAVSTSNPPFTAISVPAEFGGFGIDTAGAFSGGAPIEFEDQGPFAKGIGAHPTSSISFDLDALRAVADFNRFQAVVGLDLSGSPGAGVTFRVLLDGVEALVEERANRAAGGRFINLPTGASSTLTLVTEYLGAANNNHGAWADAKLTSAPGVPTLVVEKPFATPLVNGETFDYGDVLIGSFDDPTTFTIRNTGNTPLAIDSITITGDDRGDFALTGAPPASLDPDQSTFVDVNFVPTAAGPRTATLIITSNDLASPFQVALTGTGLSPLDVAQQAYLKASNTERTDQFGLAVAVSGNTIVVGAPEEDSAATGVNGNETADGATDSGAAYVFVRDESGTWSQQAYLKASNTGSFDRFGQSVAISGDTVVIGALNEDSAAMGVNGDDSDNSSGNSGAAYVFVRDESGTWRQEAYLKAANTGADDRFGHSVAVSGDTVVVGAWHEDSAATGINGDGSDDTVLRAGAAYVFTRSGTRWSQDAYLKASNTGPIDQFGWSVAVSGNTVVVGAHPEDSAATGVGGNQDDNTAADSGAVYVFVRDETGIWSQQAYLKASNTGLEDRFGWSVAVSGDTLVVGTYLEDSAATGVGGDQADNSATNAGAAYVFVRDGSGTWSQQAYLKASNTGITDRFGWSVAVSGDTVVVGAHWEESAATGVNGNGNDGSAVAAGAAYLFTRSGTSWSEQAYLKAFNTGADDQFGHSVAVSGDTVIVGAPFEDSAATGVDGDGNDNTAPTSGSTYAFLADLPPAAPFITAQPVANQVIFSGTSAVLTVEAIGVPTPGIQWYETDGEVETPVPGATSSTFVTPLLFGFQSYFARATNASGSADSEVANIEVIQFANAWLADLALDAGELLPPFNGFLTDYAVTVPNATSSLTVTPEAEEPAATITVNGAVVSSGDPSDPIPLGVGSNAITIVVTAVDGVTTATYTVEVTRVAPITAVTGSVTNLTDIAAVLNGSVIPNGDVGVFFEYGTDTSYGFQTEVQYVSGPEVINLIAPIAGLVGGETYHYRIVATAPGGTVLATGSDATFTTLPDPPLAATGNAIGVTTNTATLVGAVDPRGLETKYFFEYFTGEFSGATPEQTIAAGVFGLTNVSAEVAGLDNGTTYQFRLVAMSVNGMSSTGENGFTAGGGSDPGTGEPDAAPTVVTGDADLVTSTSALLKATVNARGGTTVVRYEYGTTTASLGQLSALQGIGSADLDVPADVAISNLLPGTRYFFRPVATNSAGATAGTTGTFTTSFAAPGVQTGNAIALTTTSVLVQGAVRARSPSTAVRVDYGTDGVTFPFSRSATPGVVSGNALTPVEATLEDLSQGTTYFYRVCAVTGTPPDAVEGVGETRSFRVASLSGLFQEFPVPVPLADRSGSVQVTLSGDGGLGAWRFVGEVLWRDSGQAADGLTTGDRIVEFRPVPGTLAPPAEAVAVTSGEPPVVLARAYTAAATGAGSLNVTLKPDSLTDTALPVESRARWRFLGETDADWKLSDVPVSGLAPGDYVLEFEEVGGRTTPAPVTVRVVDGDTSIATITWFIAEEALGRLPAVLDFEEDVSVTEVLPYPFAGQLRSDAGLATGFVVQRKVVATVGHAVFDDGTLAAATGLEWLFQRHAGVHEPVPQLPRGFYLLTGYEAQREADDSPGESTPQSQTLDAATLYFAEDAGRGGFSGFLASDAAENEFLLSGAPMILVGYPIDETTGDNRGRMHATAPGSVAFTPAFGETYTTADISSTGGNSGGPVCVLHPTGSYYPAALYLGGTAQTVVRAIDSDIVDLIGFAEASSAAGIGDGGGMVIDELATDIAPSTVGALSVVIEPAAARGAGAGWRISGQSAYLPSGGGIDPLNPGTYGIDFATIPGFQPPITPLVTVNGGELLTVTFLYEEIVAPPVITSAAEAPGTRGEAFEYQITATNTPTSYSFTGNLPAGLTLNAATGLISGTLEATGRFEGTMNAANSGGADSTPLAIVSAPTLTLDITSLTVAVNTPVNVQASTTETGPGLVYGSPDLPSGLSIDPVTGLLGGSPTVAGSYLVPITLTQSGATAVAELSLDVTGAAPVITRQPSAERSVEFGLTTTLSVAATGTPAPAYQWFEVDGPTATLIEGATSASFTTPPVTTAKQYKVVVESISGSVESTVTQIVLLPSTNPALADLTVDAGLFEPVLSPRFNPSILAYTATVPNFVSSVEITPTAQIAQLGEASISVGGVLLPAPTAEVPDPSSDSIDLAEGDNTIEVVVTAQDGFATRSYAVTITRSPPPTRQTDPVTDITETSATLNGTVVPNGPVAVFFEYGPLGDFSDSTAPVFLDGFASLPVQAPIVGLIGGTDYQFRLGVQTEAGTDFGETGTFTTVEPVPRTAVGDAADVTEASATFLGAVDPVDPDGPDFNVFFQWMIFVDGVEQDFDDPENPPRATAPQLIDAAGGIQEVEATVSGLIAGRRYCYRLVAAQGGEIFTISQTVAEFIAEDTVGGPPPTAPPTVTTGDVANTTSTSATLTGEVDPNGLTTFVRFEYGRSVTYGSSTPATGFGNAADPRPFTADIGGLVPGKLYHYRLVASNELGTSLGADRTFRAGFPAPQAMTGEAVAVTGSSARVGGEVRPFGAATRVFFELAGTQADFAANLVQSIEVPGVGGNLAVPVSTVFTGLQDGETRPTFYYRVRATSPGGEDTGVIRSLDLDILLGRQQKFSRPLPPATLDGELLVNLFPAGTGGWRFAGESAWRPGGVAVTGLPTGERAIEFQPVTGLIQPTAETVGIVSGEPPVVLERVYYESATSGSGRLRVTLEPDSFTGPEVPVASRAQWRLLDGDDPAWLDSGTEIGSLSPGKYLVECKPIPGRNTPSATNVVIGNDSTAEVTIPYLAPSAPTLNPARVLTLETITTSQDLPYGFVGQIRSDRGSHTGFVVKPRVVATAAQVVIDEDTLTIAPGLQWLLQRDKGTYEPEPQLARGVYVFDDYAAQRQAEGTPGVFGTASQNNNVAAMYFTEDAGRGGFSGYLASDEPANEFLESPEWKTLVGYPVNGVSPSKQGRMHATPPTTSALARVPGELVPGVPLRVFTSTAIRGDGGYIGGPVCVQQDGGAYFPAGVFLGGTFQSLTRSIDSEVIELFNRAEVSANGGDNNTTGGITQTNAVTIEGETETGAVKVFIEPAEAAAGALWALSPSPTLRFAEAQVSDLTPGDYVLTLTSVTGFDDPGTQTITVEAGKLTEVTFTYVEPRPGLAEFRQAIIDVTGNPADAEDDADPDKDGSLNSTEFEAGTDPLDPLDKFRTATSTFDGHDFTVTLQGRAGRRYELQELTDFENGIWIERASVLELLADGEVELTHVNASGGTGIYRVEVIKIDP